MGHESIAKWDKAETKTLNNDLNNDNKMQSSDKKTKETGGPIGPEPTRYGDWEKKGRCIDF